MFDKDLADNLACLITENLVIIQQRTSGVASADDFSASESGMILLDSVCMKLVAVGESIKNLDKITNKELLCQHSFIYCPGKQRSSKYIWQEFYRL